MFDPYRKWLQIPDSQRPPTYYQLLGVSREEHDPQVIEEAALMRTGHIRNFQNTKYAVDCLRILNEIAEAQSVLLDPRRRAAYDATLPPADPMASSAPTAIVPAPGQTPAGAPKTKSRQGTRTIILVGISTMVVLAGIVLIAVSLARNGEQSSDTEDTNPVAKANNLAPPSAKQDKRGKDTVANSTPDNQSESPTLAAKASQTDPANEAATFEGRWIAVYLQIPVKGPVPAKVLAKTNQHWVFYGNTLTVVTDTKPKPTVYQGSVSMRVMGGERHFDFQMKNVVANSPIKPVWSGIYEWKNDVLNIGFRMGDNHVERLTSFPQSSDRGVTYIRLRRQVPKTKAKR